jgi:uncharacterized protein YkwD
MKRWLLVALVMLIALFTAAVVLLPAADDDLPDTADAEGLCWGKTCELVNQARADKGLKPLRQRGSLSDVADDWAHVLATTRVLKHNPRLFSQVNNWTLIAENVGYGPDVRTIHRAFMASPEHRENILEPRFNALGIGKERDTLGTLWIVQIFKRPE